MLSFEGNGAKKIYGYMRMRKESSNDVYGMDFPFGFVILGRTLGKKNGRPFHFVNKNCKTNEYYMWYRCYNGIR